MNIVDYASNWISVEDKLPHKNERVIVTCVNYTNHMDEHVSVSTYFGNNRWSGHKKVTHWMPLPELPRVIQKRRERYGTSIGYLNKCY